MKICLILHHVDRSCLHGRCFEFEEAGFQKERGKATSAVAHGGGGVSFGRLTHLWASWAWSAIRREAEGSCWLPRVQVTLTGSAGGQESGFGSQRLLYVCMSEWGVKELSGEKWGAVVYERLHHLYSLFCGVTGCLLVNAPLALRLKYVRNNCH